MTRWSSIPPTLRLVIVGEMGLLCLALLFGYLAGLEILTPSTPPNGIVVVTGRGILATLPLVLMFAVLQRSRYRPIVELNSFVDDQLLPLFDNTGLTFVVVGLSAGIGEEFFFRGLLQQGLAIYVPGPVAILLAAVAFGAVHYATLTYAVLAGLVGVYLGWIYVQFGIVEAAMAHSFYDVLVLWILMARRRKRVVGEPADAECSTDHSAGSATSET